MGDDDAFQDFFNKKDKKKKKAGVSTISTTDTLKLLSEVVPESRPVSNVTEKQTSVSSENSEWKEIDQVQQDYSGLRVSSLTTQAEKPNEAEDQPDPSTQASGNKPTSTGTKNWASTIGGSTQEETPADTTPAPKPAEPAKYRPPGLSRGTPQKQSDVDLNAANFPSLAAASAPEKKKTESPWGKKPATDSPKVDAPKGTPPQSSGSNSYVPPHMRNK